MQNKITRQIKARCQLCTPGRLLAALSFHDLIAGKPQLNSRTGMDDVVDTGVAGPEAAQQRAVGCIDNRTCLKPCDIPCQSRYGCSPSQEPDPPHPVCRVRHSPQTDTYPELLKIRRSRHRRPYIHQGTQEPFLFRPLLRYHNTAVLRHLLCMVRIRYMRSSWVISFLSFQITALL